jgi:hypothetical protein
MTANKDITIDFFVHEAHGQALIENAAQDLKSLGIDLELISPTSVQLVVKKNTWCRRSRRGQPPPEARFDCGLVVEGPRIKFTLPAQYRLQEQFFISLISHIARKWKLSKK